jgi:hypothetical protein
MLPYKVTESSSAFSFPLAGLESSGNTLHISRGVADRRGDTLAAGRAPRKGLRTKERRGRREDGGYRTKYRGGDGGVGGRMEEGGRRMEERGWRREDGGGFGWIWPCIS